MRVTTLRLVGRAAMPIGTASNFRHASCSVSPRARPGRGIRVRPSSGGAFGVEVDPDREEVGADGSDHEPVHRPADPLEAGSGVVVREHGGGAAAPAAADLHAYPRISFEVADVVGVASVLGDDPERVTVQAVADGV